MKPCSIETRPRFYIHVCIKYICIKKTPPMVLQTGCKYIMYAWKMFLVYRTTLASCNNYSIEVVRLDLWQSRHPISARLPISGWETFFKLHVQLMIQTSFSMANVGILLIWHHLNNQFVSNLNNMPLIIHLYIVKIKTIQLNISLILEGNLFFWKMKMQFFVLNN